MASGAGCFILGCSSGGASAPGGHPAPDRGGVDAGLLRDLGGSCRDFRFKLLGERALGNELSGGRGAVSAITKRTLRGWVSPRGEWVCETNPTRVGQRAASKFAKRTLRGSFPSWS